MTKSEREGGGGVQSYPHRDSSVDDLTFCPTYSGNWRTLSPKYLVSFLLLGPLSLGSGPRIPGPFQYPSLLTNLHKLMGLRGHRAS